MYYFNKNIFSALLILALCGGSICAQPFTDPPGGGQFLKRIEYNLLGNGLQNLKSKTEVEKLFFGDFNAKLEFFVEPSFEGAYGFRIVRDTLTASHLIELKSA
jgi:hypothetical protein